jgi:lipase maturation factor 1
MEWFSSAFRWLFDSQQGASDRLIPRWLFLRALGLIYFSAFFSLIFQIRGLIGPHGILPAVDYLHAVAQAFGRTRGLWFAPTLLWFSSSSHALIALCWVGMIASLLLVANLWPRGMLFLCFVCFLSFVAAAQDFSGYQSDGMLLEAGCISLFFAPRGFRPGLGAHSPPSRASLFLLQWEWFRIYFESGVAKILGGDPEWRQFTAMDEYYQNGPLPTWIGWYMQHLPHWFHAATVYATLALELGVVWMLFLPRRWRIACFFLVTGWEIGIIFTANYTFLNYLVLSLGFLLLDDRFVMALLKKCGAGAPSTGSGQTLARDCRKLVQSFRGKITEGVANESGAHQEAPEKPDAATPARRAFRSLTLSFSAAMLTWIFYATATEQIQMLSPFPLPMAPVMALEPFRVANRYGLFGIMTRGRYELEFQGSEDGKSWVAYPFRFKPQDPGKAPGIYAPYQPRFDWNLWFASLGGWRDYPIVANAEVRLLSNDEDVLALFAGNPFPHTPPHQVRVVIWQYWFTSMAEKKSQGLWWRRELLGLYAPAIEREAGGSIRAVEWPAEARPRE